MASWPCACGRSVDRAGAGGFPGDCLVEQLQPIELALGPDLLRRADHRVHQAEPDARQRIAVATQRQQCDADDEQDRVVEREDVGAQDRRVGTGGSPTAVFASPLRRRTWPVDIRARALDRSIKIRATQVPSA